MAYTQQYRYQPLPGLDYIRLLRLDIEADEHLPVAASLEVHHFDDNILPYQPLSYSWATQNGDDSPIREMRLDGCRKAITENLHHGLIQIRNRVYADRLRGDTLFWIDALCINQDDKAERSSQVAMMGQIFARGCATVVWLGHNTEEMDGAAYEAMEISCDFFYGTSDAISYLDSLPETLDERQLLRLVDYTGQDLGSTKPLIQNRLKRLCVHEWYNFYLTVDRWYRAVESVVQRRYFTRRWIIQELYFSNDRPVLALWGKHMMNASDIRQALWYLKMPKSVLSSIPRLADSNHFTNNDRFRRDQLENIAPPHHGLFNLDRQEWTAPVEDVLDLPGSSVVDWLRQIPTKSDAIDNMYSRFVEFLYHFSSTQCKDPLDRVYAFHSILGRISTFDIDYRSSVEEAYVRVAKAIVEAGYLIWVLDNAACRTINHETTGPGMYDLPSWVPDFSMPLPRRATGHFVEQFCVNFADHNRVLRVKAALAQVTIKNRPRELLSRKTAGEMLCLFEDTQVNERDASMYLLGLDVASCLKYHSHTAEIMRAISLPNQLEPLTDDKTPPQPNLFFRLIEHLVVNRLEIVERFGNERDFGWISIV
jgi:uncharacterized protein YceK